MIHAFFNETSSRRLEAAADEHDDLERLLESLEAAFSRPDLTREQARILAALCEQAARSIRRRRDAAIDRMRRDLDAQAKRIVELSSQLERERETVRAALSVARAGLWECRLSDGRLTWTDGVYDLFDLPRGHALYRDEVLGCYRRASLLRLEEMRSQAINGGAGFRLDAEIETARGVRRWIRLSGAVERHGGAPVRLYGLKQDVTEEKTLAEEAARLADVDALTGLANRRLFDRRLAELAERPDSLLILIDLDGFKAINDAFGHLVGDSCLDAAAMRLRIVGRGATLIARIGGDEFALLYEQGLDRGNAERAARRVIEALRMPVENCGAMLELGASAGLARANRSSPEDWMARADRALYRAKASGRGTFRTDEPARDFGRAAASTSPDEFPRGKRLPALGSRG